MADDNTQLPTDKLPADDSKRVEGFSSRFNELLDRATYPKHGRFTRGSHAANVAVSTFKQWCTADQAPRNYSDLVDLIKVIILDVPGKHDPHAIAAWLLAGESVPHPFKDAEIDFVLIGDIYLVISTIASKRNSQLTPATMQEFIAWIQQYVVHQRKIGKCSGPIRHDEDVKRIVNSALDLFDAGLNPLDLKLGEASKNQNPYRLSDAIKDT